MGDERSLQQVDFVSAHEIIDKDALSWLILLLGCKTAPALPDARIAAAQKRVDHDG